MGRPKFSAWSGLDRRMLVRRAGWEWRISSEGDRAGEIYSRGGWGHLPGTVDGHVGGCDRVYIAVPGHEPTRQPWRCVQIRAWKVPTSRMGHGR
jgi:hypothetical protein